MVDELAAKRFDKAVCADEASVEGALNAALREVGKSQFESAYIILIDEDGDQHIYSAGPECGTLRSVWLVLQRALFGVMEDMNRGS